MRPLLLALALAGCGPVSTGFGTDNPPPPSGDGGLDAGYPPGVVDAGPDASVEQRVPLADGGEGLEPCTLESECSNVQTGEHSVDGGSVWSAPCDGGTTPLCGAGGRCCL